MKHLLYAAAAAVAVAASSCSGNDDAVMGRIDVASAISSPSELKVSEIGKAIRYVPLATGDSFLVANRWKLRVVGDRAVVCNTGSSAAGAGSSVLAFDLADGRFLNHIGHAGQDPEAYRRPEFVTDSKGHTLFFCGVGDSLVRYDVDGRFLGTAPTSFPAAGQLPAAVVDTMRVYALTGFMEVPVPYLSAVFVGPSGVVADSLPIVRRAAADDPVDLGSIGGITVMKTPGLMRNSQQGLSGLKMDARPASYRSDDAPLWYTPEGDIHAMLAFSDTIFSVGCGREQRPVMVMDFGDRAYTAADNGRRDISDDDLIVSDIIESSDKLFLGVRKGWRTDDDERNFIGYYDKVSGTTRMTRAADGFVDDLTGFMPFYPVVAAPDGSLIGILTQEDILKWIEEHPDATVPQQLQAVADSEEEPNPVLVILK